MAQQTYLHTLRLALGPAAPLERIEILNMLYERHLRRHIPTEFQTLIHHLALQRNIVGRNIEALRLRGLVEVGIVKGDRRLRTAQLSAMGLELMEQANKP